MLSFKKAMYYSTKGRVLHRKRPCFVLQYAANRKAENFLFIGNVFLSILPKSISVLFSTV